MNTTLKNVAITNPKTDSSDVVKVASDKLSKCDIKYLADNEGVEMNILTVWLFEP